MTPDDAMIMSQELINQIQDPTQRYWAQQQHDLMVHQRREAVEKLKEREAVKAIWE